MGEDTSWFGVGEGVHKDFVNAGVGVGADRDHLWKPLAAGDGLHCVQNGCSGIDDTAFPLLLVPTDLS